MIGFVVYVLAENKATQTSGDTTSQNQFIPDNTYDENDLPGNSDDSFEDVDPVIPEVVPNPVPEGDQPYTGVIAPAFTAEEIKQLNTMIEGYNGGVSVYYEDLHSGNVYTFNEDEKYFVASIIKAPYCMYLYDLASQGKCDLTEIVKITTKDFKEGTGKIKDIEFERDPDTQEMIPIEMTVQELISYSLLYSDNTAMEMLRKMYNYEGYTEYALSLGINYKEDIEHITNGKLTAKDGGVYAKALNTFFKTNPYGEALKSDMMKTRNAMIRSKSPMARKYGWAEEAFHDMAIVYAEHPYVMVILTNHDSGKRDDYKIFAEISTAIEKLQASKYELAQ